jgi:hypothetical protein
MTQEEEALVEQAVARVMERLHGPLTLDTLSAGGMLAVGYGLPLGEEAEEIRSALSQGRPVRVKAQGLEWRKLEKTAPPGLRALWRQGEQRLTALGVELTEAAPQRKGAARRSLVTLSRAQSLAQQGKPLPPEAIITPAAADYWKERKECW